jgi:hypothetical protein
MSEEKRSQIIKFNPKAVWSCLLVAHFLQNDRVASVNLSQHWIVTSRHVQAGAIQNSLQVRTVLKAGKQLQGMITHCSRLVLPPSWCPANSSERISLLATKLMAAPANCDPSFAYSSFIGSLTVSLACSLPAQAELLFFKKIIIIVFAIMKYI